MRITCIFSAVNESFQYDLWLAQYEPSIVVLCLHMDYGETNSGTRFAGEGGTRHS